MTSTAFLRRVRLRNYKSIGTCDVNLGALTFLVGANGSGKSNFLDAVRFVADALNQSLDHAVRDRGGVNEVRRRTGGHPTNFGIRLDFADAVMQGSYAFEIRAEADNSWSVKQEACEVTSAAGFLAKFEVEDGTVRSFVPDTSTGMPIDSVDSAPPAAADRLYLVTASGLPRFRMVFDGLSRMGFYNLNPDAMRELQPPDPSQLLKRDGSNLASVLARLEHRPGAKQRLVEYLARVVPGVVDVEHKVFGPRETVEFRQQVDGAKDPWRVVAQNMSDGTLRALGILLALQQTGNGLPIRVIGIEEPETALHPAAVGVLLDSLRDAAARTQIIATSHSADLLDDKSLPDEAILAVVAEGNASRIGPLDQTGRQVLRDRLYTAGELLRMDQLHPDPAASNPKQLTLFGANA